MPVTVTLAQIAKFAQVQRPSVSNWRRRHGDFPRPVGGSAAQPLFDAEQVAQWLDQRPNSLPQQRSATYGELFREGLRRGPAVGTHFADADARVRAGLAVAALRHLYGRPLPPSEEQLRATAEAAEAQHVDLTGVFQPLREHPAVALSQLADVERLLGQLGAPAAAEAIIESAAGTWWAAPTQTPTAISDLALQIASELLGESGELAVADLAAGTGAFLATVASRGRARTARFAETDPAAVELMRLRLLCHGLRDVAPYEDGAGADVVFVDPPFQSGEHEQQQDHPLSWAARVVECLDDDAVGFAVVPQWTLTRTATATRLPVTWVREQLVRRGCVRAIIQLPRHVHPHLGGADLVLLVLAADTGDTTRPVVVCDADRVRARAGENWIQHTAELVCGSPTGRDARLCREVPASELLAGRTLLPAHLLTPQAAPQDHLLDAVRARTVAIAAFTTAVDAVSTLDRIDITPRQARTTYRSIGELIRGRQLIRLPGHRIPAGQLTRQGQRVLGREELLGHLPVGARRIELAALGQYNAAAVTEPGDVIVLTGDQLRAIVDEQGGSVLLTPVQGLRIPGHVKHSSLHRDEPQQAWIGPYALASLMIADRNIARGDRRAGLDHLDVPVLSPTELQQLDLAAQELTELVEQAQQQANGLDAARRRLATGVAAGAFSLRMKPSTTK